MADNENGLAKGQGATSENLDPGHTGSGNLPPVDTGVKKPEPSPEEKAAADKAAADAAAKEAEAKAAEEAAKAGKEQEEEEESTKEWDGEYMQMDDPAGQSVINLLKDSGVTAREANSYFADALKAGDPSKIDWKAIESRLGPDKTRLAQIGVKDYYDRVYSENVKTTEKAYEIVGGKDNWSKIAKWVKATEARDPKSKADFDEIRRGIDAGGRLAVHAVNDLKAMYEKDPKNNGLGTGKVHRGDSVNRDANGSPLSRGEYLKLVKEANSEGKPYSYIQSLQARREAGRKQGL